MDDLNFTARIRIKEIDLLLRTVLIFCEDNYYCIAHACIGGELPILRGFIYPTLVH